MGSGHNSLFNKFVPRKSFSNDKKWNGSHDKFASSEAALNSYALTSGMPYMISNTLTAVHQSGGHSLNNTYAQFVDNNGNTFEQLGVSFKQFQHDSQAMFGAIELLCDGQYAKDIIRRYRQTCDGISTYHDLITEFCIPPSVRTCLLYTSPSPRDRTRSRMPSSA